MTSTADTATEPRPEEPVRGAPAEAARRRSPPPWLVVAGTVIGVAFATPVGFLVLRNLLDGTYLTTVAETDLLRPTFNTLLLAVTVSGSTAVLGTGAAWL
ncbi:MAG: hypothetical protein R3343_13870, partial [Nitriliruptorales bacterium]|nr:hypothetical protein [Nitriliruptorales bacterium]